MMRVNGRALGVEADHSHGLRFRFALLKKVNVVQKVAFSDYRKFQDRLPNRCYPRFTP